MKSIGARDLMRKAAAVLISCAAIAALWGCAADKKGISEDTAAAVTAEGAVTEATAVDESPIGKETEAARKKSAQAEKTDPEETFANETEETRGAADETNSITTPTVTGGAEDADAETSAASQRAEKGRAKSASVNRSETPPPASGSVKNTGGKSMTKQNKTAAETEKNSAAQTGGTAHETTASAVSGADKEPEKKEHVHSYKKTVFSPTCTEKGYTKFVCSCGSEYEGEFVPAAGHSLTEWRYNFVKGVPSTIGKDYDGTHYSALSYRRECARCDYAECLSVQYESFDCSWSDHESLSGAPLHEKMWYHEISSFNDERLQAYCKETDTFANRYGGTQRMEFRYFRYYHDGKEDHITWEQARGLGLPASEKPYNYVWDTMCSVSFATDDPGEFVIYEDEFKKFCDGSGKIVYNPVFRVVNGVGYVTGEYPYGRLRK